MKLNRKGSIGFPEAIMAAMIVTLSLTLYMGMLALSAAEENSGPGVHVDHRIFGGLTLEDGEFAGDIEIRLVSEMERHGYRGISVICAVPGELDFEDRHIRVGVMDGRIESERFLMGMTSSDGRVIPAVLEVAVCA